MELNPVEQRVRNRFWAKVNKTETCWLWTGADDGSEGYGKFEEGGMWHRAHRLSYKWHNGALVPGLVILHNCDNPKCIRPDHLIQGTQKENMQDMVRRGRARKPGVPFRKLTPEQACDIYISQEPTRALARHYDMYPSSIRAIKQGKTYKAATQTLRLQPSSPVPSDEESAYILSPPPTPSRIEPCEQA